jgi:PAS domain S-box-containing protein
MPGPTFSPRYPPPPRAEATRGLPAHALPVLKPPVTGVQRAEAGHVEQYRLLFQLNPVPMWLFDTETFRFLEVNDAAVSRYGYTRQEFLEMTIAALRPSAEEVRHLEAIVEQYRATSYHGLHRHRRKDGTLLSVEITSHPLLVNGREAKLVIAHDVTAREQALALVRQSEQRFRSIIEQGSDVIRILDVDGTIVYASPSVERASGFTAAEMVGRPVSDFLHPDDAAPAAENHQQLVAHPG